MADPTRKAAVGFQGGQVLALRLSESQLKELRSVLREGRPAARGSRRRRRRWSFARSSTCGRVDEHRISYEQPAVPAGPRRGAGSALYNFCARSRAP